MKCKECVYFEHRVVDTDLSYGVCKRHAPRPIVGAIDDIDDGKYDETRWPYVKIYDWCGEGISKAQLNSKA